MNRKRLLLFLLAALLAVGLGTAVALLTRVPIPSSAEAQIVTYTRNKPTAEVTVAILDSGGTQVQAYGHDGKIIPVPERAYEIGEITQTFTGAIAAKAVAEGRLSPNEAISEVLPLSRSAYTPTVSELLTHSSAYADYAPDNSSSARLLGKNPYTGTDINALVSAMNTFHLTSEAPYLYSFSPFGAAAMGAVISEVYDVDFYSILTIFAQTELGLTHTYVSLEKTVEYGWIWNSSDAYLASCGLTSTIGDMASYVKHYLYADEDYLRLASEPFYEASADHLLGYFWDVYNGGSILASSGETSHYAAALRIDREKQAAVIVLSNYPNDKYGDVSSIAAALLSEHTAA